MVNPGILRPNQLVHFCRFWPDSAGKQSCVGDQKRSEQKPDSGFYLLAWGGGEEGLDAEES
jgi:hypothetical protein